MGPSIAVLALCLAQSPAGPEQDPGAAMVELSTRIEVAEAGFRDSLVDLAHLDVARSALAFDLELRRVERLSWVLEAEGLTPQETRRLELSVVDQLEYARYRLTRAEAASDGAWCLSRLLRDMQAAMDQGRPELALALHDESLGDEARSENAPPLLLRLLVALEGERSRAVAGLTDPTAPMPARPQAR